MKIRMHVYECVCVKEMRVGETERDSECQNSSNPYCIYNMTSDILFLKKINTTINVKTT